MKFSFLAFSVAVRITTVCALLSTTCGQLHARQTKASWHQTLDKRPRADSACATLRKDALEIGVKHSGGIGKTEFVLTRGEWPSKLQFVFRRFKALEGFKVWTDSSKFEGAVAFSNKQQLIDLGQGFTAKKKRDYIYIYGPHGFVRSNDKSIHVEWVDFYRH